jgi:hypothetical protein
MKIYREKGEEYRLSSTLNSFQLKMQIHLVNWKREYVTQDPGQHHGKPNDAILPETFANQYPMLYPDIQTAFKYHIENFPFRLHEYFNHVASSQVANINLFLPVLLHPNANQILNELKPDFARLALSELDHGYRLEYWDAPYGRLGDRTHLSGTDADIAIAYYNHEDELCLWLIEHKLTESEFTTCGAARSKGRKAIHNCNKSFSEILEDKSVCYYQSANHYNFWDITDANRDFFVNHAVHLKCPFRGGMNQLWRNQLLGLSIEQNELPPYKHVMFSVVRHPRNTYLDHSIVEYRKLIANNTKFSVFTSRDVLDAASKHSDPVLDRWILWYRELYDI